MHYACGMIKDYIPVSLCNMLDAKYQIVSTDRKRAIEEEDEQKCHPAKKVSMWKRL